MKIKLNLWSARRIIITSQFIMPGGQLEEENDVLCLQREIKEELNCDVDLSSLEHIGDYKDIAAGFTERFVNIKLYKGKILGKPIPSSEIIAFHWLTKEDQFNDKVSSIVKNKIIPDLTKRNILK